MFDTVDLGTYVTVEEGAAILGNVIRVIADGGDSGDRVRQNTENNAVGIDFASDDYELNVISIAEVNFFGKIGAGVRNAKLFIDAAGNITNRDFVDARRAGGEIIIDQLNAGSVPTSVTLLALNPTINVFDDPDHRPTFLGIPTGSPYGPDTNEQHGKVTIGSNATISQADRFNSVDVVNRSTLDVRILDMNVLYDGLPGPVVTLLAGQVVGAFTQTGPQRFNGTRIEMESHHATVGAGDFIIDGVIYNPTGSTKIVANGGSVIQPNEDGGITTGSLYIETAKGRVGEDEERIEVTILQDASLLPEARLEVHAYGEIGLDIDRAGTPMLTQLELAGLTSVSDDIFASFGGFDLLVTDLISAPGHVEMTEINNMIDAFDGEFDLVADTVYLQATGSVGHYVVKPNGAIIHSYNAFEAKINALEANVGSLYLRNAHDMEVGGTEDANVGIRATGVVDVQLPGIMHLLEDVIAGGNVILGAFDVEDTQDSVLMVDGITIQSQTADVTLLNGDVFIYNSTHRIKAAGLLTIAMDQGNVDGGVGVTFTTPDNLNRDVMQANELLIVTGPDRDNIIIPDLYIPTRFEGGADFDTIRVHLVDPPSNRTTLRNVDVEDITFTTQVTADWLIDTTQIAQQYELFGWDILSGLPAPGPTITVENSFLESSGIKVVQNTHSNADAFKAMVADYSFTDGEERLDVLQLDHIVNVHLLGGDDMLKVGGIRQAGPGDSPPRAEVAPFQVSRFLTVNAGDGNDHFLLEDPRTGDAVPYGRLGVTEDGHGLIANYEIEGAPTTEKAIIFQEFESLTVNLGETDGIFVVEDTVIPTVINLDADEDVAGDTDNGYGNDVVNVFKITADLTINGEQGDDDFNIIGTGPGARHQRRGS
ncbi:hypothetical protein [Verrucomicrobium spinosum]|uniref:hypothetical protein n=1 Tax=Verrucomicrobium spinosum TaxID=2736 RepID=UPI00094647C9|nr:hypothetical protein [Verrucomicrobium spinosum]